jgi:two-component system, response regulator
VRAYQTTCGGWRTLGFLTQLVYNFYTASSHALESSPAVGPQVGIVWILDTRLRKNHQGVRLNSKTILLVEDSPSDVALTRRALDKARIANLLIVAEDGQEALDYLLGSGAHTARDTSDQPALTLLDLKLPKIPGLEVLRRIRSEALTRRLPVVILTSSDEEQDVARSYDLGVNSYIRKPVDFRQFAQAVEQLGLYWLVLNEPPPEAARRAAR